MSNVFRVDSAHSGSATTVSFGERFQSSEQFDHIFKEGMALVERTASYLDGPGRKEAKTLTGGVGVLYATESMRLTTRLLDLASWLLIRRALREGEITDEEAQKKRRRVKLQAFGRPSHVNGYCGAAAGPEEPDRGKLRDARSHPQARSRDVEIGDLGRRLRANGQSRCAAGRHAGTRLRKAQLSGSLKLEIEKGPVVEPGL